MVVVVNVEVDPVGERRTSLVATQWRGKVRTWLIWDCDVD